jgi:ferric-dicitrate binding protein FerR (iron transport regulator)
MLFHATAGPTLLGVERGNAPVVEAPVGLARVTSATFDLSKKRGTLALLGVVAGQGEVRVRPPGSTTWQTIPVSVTPGCALEVPFSY